MSEHEPPAWSALVVVESEFGNTRAVAEAVADGIGASAELVPVDRAPVVLPETVRLLVVGGPTHAFGMSTPATRSTAAGQGGSSTGGIREWINTLRPVAGCRVATFDTRQRSMRHLPGSAARRAAKTLQHKGFGTAAAAQNFYVTATSGPLVAGETDRAREWGRQLAAELQKPAA